MGLFNFDKLKKIFKKEDTKDTVYSKLDAIKIEIIDSIVKYSESELENSTNPIMMEFDKDNNLRVYPNIDSIIKGLTYESYIYKYKNIKPGERPIIDQYIEDLVANEISLILGEYYQKSYNQWAQEFYKDADDIEEEMWNFEIKGELKYKGFIESSAEKANDYKGHINLDITPELEHKEVKLLPYVEHDENPDEVVSKDDESIEIIEVQ